MRPVNRGNPAAYPLDYLTDPGSKPNVVSAVNTMQAAVLAKVAAQQAVDTINGQLSTAGALPNTRKRRNDGTNVGANLVDIRNARPALQLAYDNARTPPVDTDALRVAGAALLANYQLEIGALTDQAKSQLKVAGTVWGLSRGDLIANIGEYCSYCEMPIGTSLAIEHQLPKSDFPLLSLSWPNFLLACAVCNGHKSNKPSRAAGTAAAITAGHNPPDETQIVQGAAGRYVWPSDPVGYPAWQNAFAYQMMKVAYDADGQRVWSNPVPDALVGRWGYARTAIQVVSDASYAIRARVSDLLDEIHSEVYAVTNELEAGRVAASLATAITALPWQYRFTGGPNPAVAATGAGQWTLTQVRTFQVDTTNQRNPLLAEVTSGSTPIAFAQPSTQRARTAFLIDLGRGVIPPAVDAVLGDQNGTYLVDPTTQDVTISRSGPIYRIQVVKSLTVATDGYALQLLAVRDYDLELHVVPVAGPLAAQAQQVVGDLQLNLVDRTDTKVSDRRMARRTRTWFTALAALRNLDRVITSGGGLYQPGNELLDLVVRTAAATGYWSVWLDVLQRFVAAADLRTNLATRILGPANFPGTR